MARASDLNRTIPLRVGRGSWMGGDAADVPEGYARRLRNQLIRSRTLQARPPFTYDALANARAMATWYDNTTGASRLAAMLTPTAFHVKDAAAETWSASLGSSAGVVDIVDAASYRGVLYMATADASGDPLGVFSYDGDSFAFVPYTSTFAGFRPRTMAVFKERLCYAGARIIVNNRFFVFMGTDYAYDASNWTGTDVDAQTFTSAGGDTISRITPTSTTNASLAALAVGGGTLNDDRLTWNGWLRNTSATYHMPMTAMFKYSATWIMDELVTAGYVRVPTTANGFRYRATIGGTTDGATEPTWPTTIGDTVTDNTVTWVCDGTDVAARHEFTVKNASVATSFTPFTITTLLPAGSSTEVTPILKFGNTATPTITLAALDFSLRDTYSDGTPLKRNYGHQLVYGSMALPFANLDAGSGTITPDPDDVLYFTEVGQPALILGTRYFVFSEVPGPVTALRVVGERLVAFKRNARRVFAAVEDERQVILPEGDARHGDGALNAKAVAVGGDGLARYIGDNGVYQWNLADEPVELCGDAMRDVIMNKSADSWCESQDAPANRALLAIDQRNRELWVYTQKGMLFCKDLDAPPGAGWTTHDMGGGDTLNPSGHEICDIAYNPTTGKMYFAFTTASAGTPGLARLDPTVTPDEDSNSTSGALPVQWEVWPRPIEATTSAADVLVDTLRFYHKITADQTGQTMRGDISFNQGVSFAKSLTFDLAPLSTGGFVPLEFPIFQAWNTVQTRLVHIGKGGASNGTISRIEAMIQVLRGYYPKTSTTSGSSTL